MNNFVLHTPYAPIPKNHTMKVHKWFKGKDSQILDLKLDTVAVQKGKI
jgi:hypothetical protein